MVLFYSNSGSFVLALDPERGIEQYNFKQWDVEDQLPQISVTALAQDDKGYIWVGTQNGVSRFNGKDFVSYSRDNTNAFHSNTISDLLFDSHKRLWVATKKGILYYSPGGFVAIDNNEQTLFKPHSIIEYNNAPLISSNNGLFSIVDNQLKAFKIKTESYALENTSLGLVIGGRGKVNILNKQKLESILLPKRFSHAVINDIKHFNGILWLATSKGLIYLENNQFYFPTNLSPLIELPTNKIYVDKNSILWVATDESTYRIKNKKLHMSNKQPQYSRVLEFMLDRDGTLWLGTSDKGLFQLWDSWSARYNELHGIEENLVWSVTGDRLTSLIVGSDKAVYQYRDNKFVKLIDASKLPNPSAYTLFIDDDRSIWVGTKSGLSHFTQEGKAIPLKSNFLNGLQINGIYRDSKKRLWVATSKGIYRQNEIGFLPLSTKSEYVNRSFRSIIEHEGILYFGSETGLLNLDVNLELKPVFSGENQHFISTMITVGDLLIVGTLSEGLFIKKNESWKNINKKLGLVSNDSFSITNIDDELWLSGFQGVYKLALTQVEKFVSGEVSVVFSEPILKDSGYLTGSQNTRCCNGAGHAKSSLIDSGLNGSGLNDIAIWYPTLNGVLKLEPRKVRKNQVLVKTQIESITSFGQTFDLYSYNPNTNSHGEVGLEEKDVSFKFIGMTSFDEGLVNYRYRLHGYNTEWKSNGTSREVFYTNLPAGDYVFEVMASNNNGLWPYAGTKFKFSIQAKYYETLAFKLFLFLIAILTLFLLYQWKLFNNRKKVERLQYLVDEKTKQLTLSNEELEKANSKLSVYSYTDPLTGAYNRRYLQKQMASDIAHYIRQYKNEPIEHSMVFILADLDFFKDINDKYGHTVGDEILARVVECLSTNIRNGDYLIRWGGEEFLIVLRPNHVAEIEIFCDRILNDVRNCEYKTEDDQNISITLSLGYCFYPLKKVIADNWSWESSINIADKALYESKNRGKNQWVGYQMMSHVIDELASNDKPQFDKTMFQRYSGSGRKVQ